MPLGSRFTVISLPVVCALLDRVKMTNSRVLVWEASGTGVGSELLEILNSLRFLILYGESLLLLCPPSFLC